MVIRKMGDEDVVVLTLPENTLPKVKIETVNVRYPKESPLSNFRRLGIPPYVSRFYQGFER